MRGGRLCLDREGREGGGVKHSETKGDEEGKRKLGVLRSQAVRRCRGAEAQIWVYAPFRIVSLAVFRLHCETDISVVRGASIAAWRRKSQCSFTRTTRDHGPPRPHTYALSGSAHQGRLLGRALAPGRPSRTADGLPPPHVCQQATGPPTPELPAPEHSTRAYQDSRPPRHR